MTDLTDNEAGAVARAFYDSVHHIKGSTSAWGDLPESDWKGSWRDAARAAIAAYQAQRPTAATIDAACVAYSMAHGGFASQGSQPIAHTGARVLDAALAHGNALRGRG